MVVIRDKVKNIELSKLKEYKKNNKIHTEEQISLLVQMIDKFGFTTPLLIDGNNEIIAGHGRKMAADRLGLNKVPCIVIDDLTENEIKTLRIADNRIGELAETSMLNIQEEYMDLLATGSGIEFLTGYTEEDFSDLLEENDTEVEEDDFEVPEDVTEIETDIKEGDIIKLGEHTLMCGDSTKDYRKILTERPDLMFTDPPYNVAFNGRSGNFEVIKNDKLPKDAFNKFIEQVIVAIKDINPRTYYICCNWKFYDVLQSNMDYSACIVWDKKHFGLGKGYRHQHEFILFNGFIKPEITNETDVWSMSRDSTSGYKHPTQKPVELSGRAITNSSNENDIIMDLFGGSGSTLIACEQLNRECYMMELDPKYCEVICQRWEKLTGKQREVLK